MNNFIPQKLQKKKAFKRLRLNFKKEKRYFKLRNSLIGLKAFKTGQLTPEILEMSRRHLRRKLGKKAVIRIIVYPTTALFKKPTGSRMGKGYGKLSNWVYPIRKGRVFIELDKVDYLLANNALFSLSKKIPFKTKVIKNYDI